MKVWRLISRTVSLREAAAIIFALTAVLPLLVFLFFLSRLELLQKTEAQLSLFLALLIALFGFVVFRGLINRISKLAQDVVAPMPAERAMPLEEARAPMVAGLGAVAEVTQIRQAFTGMLGDLRSSTERLEDLVFKLATLGEMVEVAARIPEMQDLLTLVLERTMRTVRASVGSIMLLDRERQTLRIVAAQGLPDGVLAGVEVKVGEELAGKVALLGEPVLVEDIETDPRFANATDPKYGGGSVISAPVRVGDRIIGVINLAKKPCEVASPSDSRPFSPTDLQFLKPLLTYVAYALDNARLFEETRESAKRLQAVIDELKAAQEQLVRWESLRAMGVLALGVNHHMNNLLAVVLGRIQFLLRQVEEPAIRHSLETAERAALEGAEVVRRLREFSRVHPLSKPVPADLNQVAQEVLELTRPHWQYEAELRGIRIQVSLEAGQIPTITGHPDSLREALMSLLHNSVDALPTGGRITLRTWAAAPDVFCSVADTGVGMSEEVQRRALEPFFTTKGPKRTGLGLSVAYGILQRHGGDLVIESAEGRGTTVTFRVPVAPAPAEPDGPHTVDADVPPTDLLIAGTPAPALPRDRETVLVVDDEEAVRELARNILVEHGYTVLEASDGFEALRTCKDHPHPIALVVTDVVMPGLSGRELVERLASAHPTTKFLYISGYADAATASAHGFGAALLRKPFAPEALARKVREVLDASPGRRPEVLQK